MSLRTSRSIRTPAPVTRTMGPPSQGTLSRSTTGRTYSLLTAARTDGSQRGLTLQVIGRTARSGRNTVATGGRSAPSSHVRLRQLPRGRQLDGLPPGALATAVEKPFGRVRLVDPLVRWAKSHH